MYSEEQIKGFYQNYRDSLNKQMQAANRQLEQQRQNDYQTIMSNANLGGMMYSNLPERSKIQYDQQTFMPNQVKVQQSYQTGLDKLRSNIVNYENSIGEIQKAIGELNAI